MSEWQDKKNKYIIFNLVKNYWGLSSDSLKLFKERLFYSPAIGEDYIKTFDIPKDLRIRKKLSDYISLEQISRFDKSFTYFKDAFPDFCRYTNINYSQYQNNLIRYNESKNAIKILKALKEFYSIDVFLWIRGNYSPNTLDPNIKFEDFIENLLKSFKRAFNQDLLYPVDSFYNSKIYIEYKKIYNEHLSKFDKQDGDDELILVPSSGSFSIVKKDITSYLKIQDVKNIFIELKNSEAVKEAYESFIKDIENKYNEIVSKFKVNLENLELVISFNFADWFLASTAEKWSSCLSLESSYEGNFWMNLVGLITDKNRALVYLTDGKKKNFKGIEVDRIITRSWVASERNGRRKNSSYVKNVIKVYPNGEHFFAEVFKSCFPEIKDEIGFFSNNNNVGRYYFEPIYFKNGEMAIIYNDVHTVKKSSSKKTAEGIPLYYYKNTGNADRQAIYYNSGESIDSALFSSSINGFSELERISKRKSLDFVEILQSSFDEQEDYEEDYEEDYG